MANPADANVNGYMLDTMVFNRILDQDFSLERLQGHVLFVTHIRLDEIHATTEPLRRAQLESLFSAVEHERLATETGVWGDSYWGAASGLPKTASLTGCSPG